MRLTLVFVALLFWGTVYAVPLTQIEAFNCDFDDNIFTTDAKVWISCSDTGREVPFSTADWAVAKNLLGKAGKYEHCALGNDGLREFGDTGPEGAHLFKKQIERALAEPGDTWKGPTWTAFVDAMKNPATRQHTAIITARVHSPQAIQEGLQVLVDRGLIAGLPKDIFPVMYPRFPKELGGQDDKISTGQRKAMVMMKLLREVEKAKVPEDASLVTDREGTGLEKIHLWGFSDDDFDNFSAAVKLLSAHVKEFPHVKIVLFYTGCKNRNEKPRSVVIMPNGSTRPTMFEEATRTRVQCPQASGKDRSGTETASPSSHN